MATRGSAKVLGRSDIGKLSVGMAGDLFMINLNRLELIGADLDPKSLLSTVGFKGTVDYTIVNGVIVVRDGVLVNIDEQKIYHQSQAVANKFIKGY
jgi:cytosine/adenosine deaminase-related metal-dependent hydrolase